MTKRITITEGLVDLKLYDKKITKAIDSGVYVAAEKKVSTNIGTTTKDKAASEYKASFQSVVDLIKNRNSLKAAIVQSNAVTEVTISDEKMTVAEAIERKTSIEYEKEFLDALEYQLTRAKEKCVLENTKVQNQIDNLISKIVEKDSKGKDLNEEQQLVVKTYRDANEVELFDPLDIATKIKDLRDRVDEFESSVDTALALSNATTFIEVEA